jgi:DNA-binding LacI/PurR family transcriptional regulator
MTRGEGTSPVRLRDVANAAGVNPSIASRILNNDPTLSARSETRMRVRDAARRLGYTPNAFARGLKLQRTNTLGLVLADVANPTNALLVQGLERRASHHGYVVLLADMDDFAGSGEIYGRLVLERRVDGLIVSGLMRGHRLVGDLNNHRIPYVLVDCQPTPSAVCVSVNDTDGIALAVDHLVELGHQNIAHLASFANADPGGQRFDDYRAAMDRHGLPEHHVIADVELSEAGGFEATTVLLDREPGSTAVLVAGVMQGVGAMAAIRRAGRAVPMDMSLVALQDAPLAAYLDPPLTAVRRPSREVAEAAVDLLIKLIAGDEAGDVVVPTQPKLIVRASTAASVGGPP